MLSIALLTLVAPLGGDENLIRNGSLDSANGWERAGAGVYLTHDSEAGAEKPGSLRIAVPADANKQPYNWFQRVELGKRKPARLKLTANIKLENPSGGGAAVMVQVYGEGTDALGYAWTDELRTSGDWKPVRGVFDVPRDAKYIRVLAYMAGRGTAWFDDIALAETDEPVTEPPKPGGDDDMSSLARGCAADLPWRFDGDEAREAARKSGRPVLLYVRCTDDTENLEEARTSIEARSIRLLEDGYAKDLLFRAGPLSCPEVRDLIERRTVPVCATYNLSDSRFRPEKLAGFDVKSDEVTTPALVVFDSRGKLVAQLDRIGVLSEDFVDHWLRGALEQAGAKSKEKDAPELYRDGDLDRVLALAARGGAEMALLRARTLTRLGDLDGARKALASQSSPTAEALRGRIEMRAGDFAKARERFEAAARKLNGDEQLEARFWSAWCRSTCGEVDAAREQFRALASESVLGRRAAACALEEGPHLRFAANMRSAPRGESLPNSTEGAPASAVDIARSVTALLELQRDDGSFGDSAGPTSKDYCDPTITALAAEALARAESELDRKLAARATSARKSAEQFLAEYAAVESPNYRAMEPFNLPYVADTLLRVGDKASCRSIAQRIAKLQLPDGNWTVYHAARPATINTALCVRALHRLSKAGVAIDDKALARGLDALEANRRSSDLFPYSTADGHEWMTTDHGSIARDALCEATLLECGRGSKTLLAAALGRFLEHCHELRAPTKRFYDYFNQRGHGGYYFFFAYDNALDAARAFAPAALQKKVAAATQDAVLAAQEFDGTWMDSYLLGRAYGTSMALLLLGE